MDNVATIGHNTADIRLDELAERAREIESAYLAWQRKGNTVADQRAAERLVTLVQQMRALMRAVGEHEVRRTVAEERAWQELEDFRRRLDTRETLSGRFKPEIAAISEALGDWMRQAGVDEVRTEFNGLASFTERDEIIIDDVPQLVVEEARAIAESLTLDELLRAVRRYMKRNDGFGKLAGVRVVARKDAVVR